MECPQACREHRWNATVPTIYRRSIWSRQISNARARSQLSAAQARRSSCERNHLQVRRSAQLQADREERWAGRIYFLGFGYAKAWEIYPAAASTSTIHSSSGMARGHVPPCTVLRRCGDTFWPGEHDCVCPGIAHVGLGGPLHTQ